MARPLLNNLGSASAHSDGDCCKVAMCKGSSPHLSKETQSLLRSRLRIAALLLGAGFGTFFVRQLFTADYASGWSLFMLIFQGLVTVTLLLVGGGLCHKCSYAISTLRIAELVIFGVPACVLCVHAMAELDGQRFVRGRRHRAVDAIDIGLFAVHSEHLETGRHHSQHRSLLRRGALHRAGPVESWIMWRKNQPRRTSSRCS